MTARTFEDHQHRRSLITIYFKQLKRQAHAKVAFTVSDVLSRSNQNAVESCKESFAMACVMKYIPRSANPIVTQSLRHFPLHMTLGPLYVHGLMLFILRLWDQEQARGRVSGAYMCGYDTPLWEIVMSPRAVYFLRRPSILL